MPSIYRGEAFTEDVARVLADEANLARLAEAYDLEDQGIQDVWEAIVLTGRRINEVLKVRLECIGRYGGLASSRTTRPWS